jgi:hypothetical protein
MRSELEARNTIFLLDRSIRLQEIERQVERLGFEHLYVVSATTRPNIGSAKICLRPQSVLRDSSCSLCTTE